MRRSIALPLILAASLALAACSRPEAPSPVRSHLAGTVAMRATLDETPDYAAFSVFVIDNETSGEPDTLGFTQADSTGAFALDITAEERGVYPLIVSNQGTILMAEELVVADGDSGTVRLRVPLQGRPLQVRSRENSAWLAYKNAKSQYNQRLFTTVREGDDSAATLARIVLQTSNIMWSLQDNYGGTIGADVAAAESIVMLEGWNDSLVVARAAAMGYDNLVQVDVARATRRATARLAGQDSALALVRRYQANTENADRLGALTSELVMAHLDSLQYDAAVAVVEQMQQDFVGTQWAEWADRASYELQNLRPGMPAPAFTLTSVAGLPVSLESFPEEVLLLEFYDPRDETYQRELEVRNAIYRALEGQLFNILSVSVEPDPVILEAFFEDRDIPGVHATANQGMDDPVVALYNVNILPTRFLIDGEGKIIAKFSGAAIDAVDQALVSYFPQPSD